MVNVNKMDKFYEDANDQHVTSVVVYCNYTEGATMYAYADKDLTTKIDGATLLDLFEKNLILGKFASDSEQTILARPSACQIDNSTGAVTLIVSAGGEGIEIHSAEYTA